MEELLNRVEFQVEYEYGLIGCPTIGTVVKKIQSGSKFRASERGSQVTYLHLSGQFHLGIL